MRILSIWLLCLCAYATSYATQITLDFLESKPKGLARDFYIWQFLSDENTSLEESLKAYELIFRKTPKLDNLMSSKGKVTDLPKSLYCKRLSFDNLKIQDTECIKSGLNLSSIPSMPKQHKDFLLKTFANDPDFRKKIEILSNPWILTGMLKSDAKTFSEIYNALSVNQRTQILNQNIKPEALKKLADENNKAFNAILQSIIVSQDKSFVKFKKSLVGAHITGADSYTLFMLGLNEALHKKPQSALTYFKLSGESATTPMQKNRSLFWQYYLSHNQHILKELASSTNIDIYTIYAHQKLKTNPNYQIVTDLGKLSPKKPQFNIQDPFQWQILKENLAQIKNDRDLEDLIKHFAYEDASAHLAHILTQLNKYQTSYFITPFSEKISWRDDKQKAFTYAIAKQESGLLPALVSTSYALGMMQIMPFNVQPFAKKLKKENIVLEDMFDPITALEFGTFYLDDLGKEFKHPLFVSYAYNGGPGFFRRALKSKTLFLKHRAYEPWLSMELIPYKESRDYGLKVLANYIVYQASFGNNINLEELLNQTLVN